MPRSQLFYRTRFGIGVDPAFALKMLLLFAPVELVLLALALLLALGSLLLVVVVVVVLVVVTLFFEGGVPSRAVLGDFGVNFLRFLSGVVVVTSFDKGGDGDGVFVVIVDEELFPTRRIRRAAGCGVAMVGTLACERVLRLLPVVFRFSFSLPFEVDCCVFPFPPSENDPSLGSGLLGADCGSSPSSNSTSRASFQHTVFLASLFL